jgi:hypothetical protein
MMDFTFTNQLHYLVHQVDGESGYVAHCLDLDLVGSGDDVEAAVSQLNDIVRTVVFFCLKARKSDPSSHCSKAPHEYWEMFKCAEQENGSTVRTLDVAPELAPVSVMECHFTYCLAIAA